MSNDSDVAHPFARRILNSNISATRFMLIAVAFFGLVPLVIALGRGYNPF